jgi:hypothetical protein
MPTFCEIASVKKCNKSKKSKGFKPFNALTAALAALVAKDDMKKEHISKPIRKQLFG